MSITQKDKPTEGGGGGGVGISTNSWDTICLNRNLSTALPKIMQNPPVFLKNLICWPTYYRNFLFICNSLRLYKPKFFR